MRLIISCGHKCAFFLKKPSLYQICLSPYSKVTLSVSNQVPALSCSALSWSHYKDVIIWARWRLISPASRLFPHRSMKHQSSASLAFMGGIHRWPMNSPLIRPQPVIEWGIDTWLYMCKHTACNCEVNHSLAKQTLKLEHRWGIASHRVLWEVITNPCSNLISNAWVEKAAEKSGTTLQNQLNALKYILMSLSLCKQWEVMGIVLEEILFYICMPYEAGKARQLSHDPHTSGLRRAFVVHQSNNVEDLRLVIITEIVRPPRAGELGDTTMHGFKYG